MLGCQNSGGFIFSDESQRLVLKIVISGAIVVIRHSARKPEARLSASVNWPDCA